MYFDVEVKLYVNLQTTRLLSILFGVPWRVIVILVAVGGHAGLAFAARQTGLCFVARFCDRAARVVSCARGGLSAESC